MSVFGPPGSMYPSLRMGVMRSILSISRFSSSSQCCSSGSRKWIPRIAFLLTLRWDGLVFGILALVFPCALLVLFVCYQISECVCVFPGLVVLRCYFLGISPLGCWVWFAILFTILHWYFIFRYLLFASAAVSCIGQCCCGDSSAWLSCAGWCSLPMSVLALWFRVLVLWVASTS